MSANVRTEAVQDTRWDDPTHIPLTNGPIRTVTAPNAPKYALDSDGQVIEYLMPFPMHIVDPSPCHTLSAPRTVFLSRFNDLYR